ncbi:MAG: hypothetical protein ACRC7N_00075 [Clostridium sp.]
MANSVTYIDTELIMLDNNEHNNATFSLYPCFEINRIETNENPKIFRFGLIKENNKDNIDEKIATIKYFFLGIATNLVKNKIKNTIKLAI